MLCRVIEQVGYSLGNIFFYSDPGLIIETNDVEQFLIEIGNLTADGGGDAPEPSIGATIRAIEASEPRSPIYVFTDAPASDGNRSPEAEILILQKQTRVFFALINVLQRKKRSAEDNIMQILANELHFRTKRQAAPSVYQELATFSGGQILNVDTNDLSELSSLVSSSAIQSRRTILRMINSESATYAVPIDSSILEVSISISGTRINVSALSPQGKLNINDSG